MTRPSAPPDAATWSTVDWQQVTFERPKKLSNEQWDQANAIAVGPGGFVAAGSNGDVMGYVGRIWQSGDALDWKLVDDPLLNGLELVDVAANDELFVAVGTRSSNPNDAVASILTSPNGVAWTEADSIQGAWAARVATGADGFAIVVQVGETTDLYLSPTGTSWTRVTGAEVAPGAWIADIAWDDNEWVAAGSVGDRAAVWRSRDGATWAEDRLPASEPIDGIIDVSAYRVIPGRWATLLLGLERGPSCAEDDDFCDKFQAAWSWTDSLGWTRLPKSTWILNRGYGIDVYGAADAGFLYLLDDDVRLSADGWDWAPIGGSVAGEALQSDVVVAEDRVVGVGIASSGEALDGWFGSAIVNRVVN